MIPIGGSLEDAVEVIETSRTYALDLVNGRLQGTTDGIEAIKQTVIKVLQTDRFEHLIYSANYGSEVNSLSGRSAGYVRSEIERRIREALMQDDRISAVENMQITITGDEALASFTVVSIFGDFRNEVKLNV